MNLYRYIHEKILYNSILKAFQAVVPKPNCEYNLLEIWYYDFNKIESILKDELSKKNKTSKVYTPTMGDEIKF